MALTTTVYYEGILSSDNTTHVFRSLIPGVYNISVKSFKDGVATISIACIDKTITVSEIVAGCFDKYSNFESELLRAFNADKNTGFIGIDLELNGLTVMIRKRKHNKQRIYTEWSTLIDKK